MDTLTIYATRLNGDAWYCHDVDNTGARVHKFARVQASGAKKAARAYAELFDIAQHTLADRETIKDRIASSGVESRPEHWHTAVPSTDEKGRLIFIEKGGALDPVHPTTGGRSHYSTVRVDPRDVPPGGLPATPASNPRHKKAFRRWYSPNE